MLKQITQYIANNTSMTIGVDLFSGWRPEEAQDACAVVLETNGGDPDFFHKDYADQYIQVVARGGTYYTARAIAQEVFSFLHGKSGIFLPFFSGLTNYYANVIEAMQTPQYLGQDEKGRHEFSVSFVFKIQEI